MKNFWEIKNTYVYRLNTNAMFSGFELYSRWVPLSDP